MRKTKLSKYFAVITALSMIAVSPMAALAETVTQVTVTGKEDPKTVDAVFNDSAYTGVSMKYGLSLELDGNVTVKDNVTVGDTAAASKTGVLNGVEISSDGGKATVNIGGSINTEVTQGKDIDAKGIVTSGATSNITVGGDVKANNNTKYGYATAVESGTDGDVSFGGNNTINIKGNVEATADDYRGVAHGIVTLDKTNMTVGGNVVVSAENGVAFGAIIGNRRSEGELKIDGSMDVSGTIAYGIMVKSDDIAAGKDKIIDVIVGGDVDASVGDINTSGEHGGIGIFIGNNDKKVNITVEGDIKGNTYGIVSGSENTGDLKIVSGGTISSETDAAIVVAKPSEGENAPEITVWKIESGTDNLVEAGYGNKEYAKEFEKTINYIIKADATENGSTSSNGKIVLKGTTGTVTVGDKTYDTAHQDETITINVEVADGYKYSLSNGSAVLTANADGSYTIKVPAGGGVDLKAVLEKIEEQRKNSSTRNSDRYSSGSSSSSTTASTAPSIIYNSNWTQDANGWKFKKADGNYAANEWSQVSYNGITSWYHFNSDGYAEGGWFTDNDGQRYYLDNDHNGTFGQMITGWKEINGLWYYFNALTANGHSLGSLITNGITPDGYTVNADGAWMQ